LYHAKPVTHLGKQAVHLLGGDVHAAVAQRLAGLFLDGGIDAPELRAAARQELADELVFRAEAVPVLAALSDLAPVVLKGRQLAQVAWPRPELRPVGDLDLLIDETELVPAIAALAALGYAPPRDRPRARLRAHDYAVELWPPTGKRIAVDLHTRPFRSVGSAIDPAALLARAQPATLYGQPIRDLEPADRLLFVAVHAAKHAVRSLKWLLDLHGLAALADEPTWARAAERARASGTARPFWAAIRLVDEPRVQSLAPRAPIRQLIARLVTVEDAVAGRPRSAFEKYLLEVSLEPSLRRRARMAAGLAERLARSW
jgi:hypothetical protein